MRPYDQPQGQQILRHQVVSLDKPLPLEDGETMRSWYFDSVGKEWNIITQAPYSEEMKP